MPELPEAEVVARQIRAHLLGATLGAIWIGRDDIVRQGLARRPWYPGATLSGVQRRGKSVVLALTKSEETRFLVAELGMTGLLLFSWAKGAYEKHTHARLMFEGGQEPELRYWNPRRFGRLSLLDATELEHYTERRFGQDPLTISWQEFWDLLKGHRVRLKTWLLQQQQLAGLGNIYANEVLFRAGIHPYQRTDRLSMRRGRRLHEEIQSVLREAIEFGGSSIRDFVAPNGAKGRYVARHQIYNRAAQPCMTGCGAIIQVLKAERTSFYCPRCQRL